MRDDELGQAGRSPGLGLDAEQGEADPPRRSRPPGPRTHRPTRVAGRRFVFSHHGRWLGEVDREQACGPRRHVVETSTPGARTPPTSSPSGETASKLVNVPEKSTTMQGAPYRSTAATAFAIRSGPTWRGSRSRPAVRWTSAGPSTSSQALARPALVGTRKRRTARRPRRDPLEAGDPRARARAARARRRCALGLGGDARTCRASLALEARAAACSRRGGRRRMWRAYWNPKSGRRRMVARISITRRCSRGERKCTRSARAFRSCTTASCSISAAECGANAQQPISMSARMRARCALGQTGAKLAVLARARGGEDGDEQLDGADGPLRHRRQAPCGPTYIRADGKPVSGA